MDKGVDGRKHPVLRKPLISHSISPAFFGVVSSCEVVSKQEGGHQEVFSIPSFSVLEACHRMLLGAVLNSLLSRLVLNLGLPEQLHQRNQILFPLPIKEVDLSSHQLPIVIDWRS